MLAQSDPIKRWTLYIITFAYTNVRFGGQSVVKTENKLLQKQTMVVNFEHNLFV